MDEIHGYIERITFQSPENGFTVARLKERGKRELTAIVGPMPSVQAGESVVCRGRWREDPNYGLQFQVESYEVEAPQSLQGIKKYLGSGLVKGIGPVFAERIVEYHREKTLDIIDGQPDALLDIDGIGPKRLERIKSCWKEQKSIRELMLFLQGYGISPTYAQKVFKTYGDDSRRVIEENPYQLARDVWGIGFKTADQTARKLGIDSQSDIRIDAGVEYVLSRLANEGHTCYPREAFLERARELLEVDSERIEARLEFIEQEARIVIQPLEYQGEVAPFIWLKAFFTSEQGIARELRRLLDNPPAVLYSQPELGLQAAEAQMGIRLAPNQREAVTSSLKEKMHIITGGPGTGKSTIIKAILSIAGPGGGRILLAAPTGRAGKRMAEITGREASTIHSLLEYDFSIGGFRRSRDNPLDCNLLIIDEASMVDTMLMYSLLKAAPCHARLLLVGDVDQLPSVGAGSVLQDLIRSGRLPVTRLTDIFRQAARSKIITNAHRINAGEFPDIRVDKTGDFFFIEENDPERIAQAITGLVQHRLPKTYGFDPLRDIQVLSPMNRGVIGNRNLNHLLQRTLNPSNEPLVKMGRTFHTKDKVMQVQNNYDKEVFNGDVGYIKRIDRIEQQVIVEIDGRPIPYDFADLDQLVLAYSVSIHKYQGSECPCVVLPLHTTHYMMLFRNLLYTGITRGKRLVVVIGSKQALSIAVRNKQAGERFTGLKEAVEP
ncbi:MAG: ATP-dependent RecD-like DNA helicase [Lewinellaceae bacterium]|nr:ATP-dependent RecD-like DNA helicase [Phaeodactylibacter sp.]MCB9351469.1 ATP-dependent RecD-like DNA helicase [Lewinellaceae bacterium]